MISLISYRSIKQTPEGGWMQTCGSQLKAAAMGVCFVTSCFFFFFFCFTHYFNFLCVTLHLQTSSFSNSSQTQITNRKRRLLSRENDVTHTHISPLSHTHIKTTTNMHTVVHDVSQALDTHLQCSCVTHGVIMASVSTSTQANTAHTAAQLRH